MTVRSWLWFLTRTTDCRIFQEKTVPDIIKEVFQDHSMAVFDDGLTGTYAQREYCVQYRETDFNFVSRLMEEEGIYYYFEHSDGKHTLKLVDSDSGHKKLEGKSSIAYHLPGRSLHGDEEFIQLFRQQLRIQPGNVAMRSFDHTKPKADLGVKAKNVEQHESADYEIYDFEGDYVQTDNGDHFARVRIDELHSEFDLAEAECNVREIAVGHLFTLTNAPRKDQEKDYLIVKAEYDLQNNTYETNTNEDAIYHCAMTVLQSRQQFRPARLNPRPTMGGPRRRSSSDPAARRSTATSTAGSRCSSTGTATARRTRTRAAGSASPTRGPAPTGADGRSAHGPGGDRRLPGGRSRPAHHHRARLQRRPDAARTRCRPT